MKKVLFFLNTAVILIPILVLLGWQFDIETLKRPDYSWAPMNPVTALCILLSGMSLYFATQKPEQKHFQQIAIFFALLVFAAGLVKFITLSGGSDMGIDTWLYPQKVINESVDRGTDRMSLNSALTFFLYGIALLLFHISNVRAKKVANYLAFVVVLIGLFSIIGFVYHVKEAFGSLTLRYLAIHSVLCYIFLGLALLTGNNQVGFMAVFSSPNISSKFARLLIPASVLIPITLGYIRLFAQWRKPVSVELGVSMLIISVIAVFLSLTWYVSVALNKADIRRLAAEEELKHKNESLLEAKERLLLATEGITAGIWDWVDVTMDFQIWNSKFYSLLGYNYNEVPSSAKTLLPLIHPDDAEHFSKLLHAHFAGTTRFELEHRIKTKNGVYKWFLNTGQAKFDAKGQVTRFVGSIIDIDEKKRNENILLEQSALIQIIPDAIIVMDTELRITSWNKGAEMLYELDAPDAVGKSLYEMAHVATTEKQRAERLNQLKTAGIVRNEISLITLTGKKLIILATTKIVKDAQGKMTGTVAIHTDITSLKANEERLQLATEGTAAGLWDWIDMTGDEEWWSSRFYELLGYANNEIPASAKTFREIMHPDDFKRIAKKLDAHFRHQSRFEIEARLKTKSGVYKWFLGTGQVSRNHEGVPVRMVGSIIDIDEQKKTRDFTEQQAALINMLPDGIVFYSKGMRFADINAGAEKLFDLRRNEVIGKDLNGFISFSLPSGEIFEDSLAGLWETGFYRNEIEITNRLSGKTVQVLVTIKKMENAYGGEPLFMAIYTDLTPLRINEELKKALKNLETNNQYLEQFAYISAHDIKAPIITISGLIELMTSSNAVKKEHLGILKMLTSSIRQIQRTNHSLNNILKLRKNLLTKETANDQSFPLQTIFDDVKAGLQGEIEAANATVEVNLNDLGETNFNYVYVKSILYNLLSNAIKYRDPARPLFIRVTALKTNDNKLRFIVEDNGLGFDAERNKPKMFGIFKRFHTHVDGSGVGLHIVKSIVDEYNGSIEVQSEPGKGARFVIDFNKNILA